MDVDVNVAANRMYYALYHACWSMLEQSQEPLPPGVDHWPHRRLKEDWRMVARQFAKVAPGEQFTEGMWRKVFDDALEQRVAADYRPCGAVEARLRKYKPKIEHYLRILGCLTTTP